MKPIQEVRIAVGGPSILLFASLIGYAATFGGSTVAERLTGTIGTVGPTVDGVESQTTSTGKVITPTAARGAIFQDLNPVFRNAPQLRANHAAAVSVSPNGQLLAILTSGWNRHLDKDGADDSQLSNEYVFLFDITGPQPRQVQVLLIPNTFQGLAWGTTSSSLFVSGGKDDLVHEFVRDGDQFIPGRKFELHHQPAMTLKTEPAVSLPPLAGALAISPDGARLLVANLQHDSVSLIDLKAGSVVAEQDLRPGKIDPSQHGRPGGSYPRSVVWISDDRAYAASERDRELISLTIHNHDIHVLRRVPVHGQPVALLTNKNGSRVYAALDNTDFVAVLDVQTDKLIEQFNVLAPDSAYINSAKLGGANSNALALTPDGRTLLVSNGGQNSVAVVRLSDQSAGNSEIRNRARSAHPAKREKAPEREDAAEGVQSRVVGLVPTGWYPTGVAVSKNGATWYVVNGKSPPGSNAASCREENLFNGKCRMIETKPGEDWSREVTYATDQAVIQLEKAGFLTIPAPNPLELAGLTRQVAHNNGFDTPAQSAGDAKLFEFLKQRVKHVIYVIKENRSYDQILGDLEIGNGDPRLALFGKDTTPNQHALARNFVTVDNFLVSGEGSWTGWQWSTAARTSDFAERNDFLSLAGRGGDHAGPGVSRMLNMAHATSSERNAEFPLAPADPDILPGNRSVDDLDGPGGELGKGFLWDAVLRSGKKVRNYGFWAYSLPTGSFFRPGPLTREPYAGKEQVFFPSVPSLVPVTDIYYRGWDAAVPDLWRYREWRREFDEFVQRGTLPDLMLVGLGGDHTGLFDKALDAVNTPETQVADNDYALGLLVEAVANSPFAQSTLIISIEDDTWNGFDHANAFRSPIFVAGPYVRQHAMVSRRYTTVSVVKTIEEILGTGPIGLNDALAAPMSEVFDPNVSNWTYKATVPDVLYSTKLPLPPAIHASNAAPKHSAEYWTRAMAAQDFSGPDRINPLTFNRALWRGLKGNEPYPGAPTGADLRPDREQLLAKLQPTRGQNTRRDRSRDEK